MLGSNSGLILRLIVAGVFLLAPVIIGLAGAVLPALNWFPVLGRDSFSLEPFADLLAIPGFWHSLWLSVFTGVVATIISTALALILPGVLFASSAFGGLRRLMAPMLSLPHITVAVGIVFLLQPSGWLFRLISPELSGWDRPPNLALIPDEYGLMLVLGLIAKEVPFLVLMVLAALGQIDTTRLLAVARSLGYTQMRAWFAVIIPQLWVRVRLAVLIVLVFSLSVVDMAIVLAPSLPAPLAPRTVEWYLDPDLDTRFVASASAVLQLGLAVAFMGALVLGEKITARLARGSLIRGGDGYRYQNSYWWRWVARLMRGIVIIASTAPLILAILGMAAALLWSVAELWRFPDAFPQGFTFRYWASLGGGLGGIVINTLILGGVSALISLILAIAWLEQGPRQTVAEKLFFLPLLIPQIGFLFGLQVMLLVLGLDGEVVAVIWIHSLYVFPYIWLALAPAWRCWNPKWGEVAASLGQNPYRRFISIKLPMLLTPILTSFAIGFSVSAALYLPTVFAGNARIQTLTVEAVTLASAAGRQPLGVATGLQMALPLMVFMLAGGISRWRFKRFSGIS